MLLLGGGIVDWVALNWVGLGHGVLESACIVVVRDVGGCVKDDAAFVLPDDVTDWCEEKAVNEMVYPTGEHHDEVVVTVTDDFLVRLSGGLLNACVVVIEVAPVNIGASAQGRGADGGAVFEDMKGARVVNFGVSWGVVDMMFDSVDSGLDGFEGMWSWQY